MEAELTAIKETLRAKSNEKAKTAFQKFVPTSQRVYGVRVPALNELAREYRNGSFELAEALWNSGAFEERLLAAKILGRVCKKDPERMLRLVNKFAGDISDWAVCDTLGMQSLKDIALLKQTEIFCLSTRFVKSKSAWKRRLAVVLLTHFVKEKQSRARIVEILKQVRDDKEHYVKKAVEWLERDLKE